MSINRFYLHINIPVFYGILRVESIRMLGDEMKSSRFQRVQSLLEYITLDNGEKLVKKMATPTGERELLRQLEFYQNVPKEIACHYPSVLESNTKDKPYYFTMPFYDYPTLTELVLYSNLTREQLTLKLLSVLNFLFDHQHNFIVGSPQVDYIKEVYISRVIDRLIYSAQLDQLFHDVINLRFIEINGLQIISPFFLLKKLAAAVAFLKRLTPTKLYLTHGQLRFDHILINADDSTNEKFILLEPRGLKELRDLGYELGKIHQCLKSRILWIEQREFTNFSFSIVRDTLVVENFHLNLPYRQDIADYMLWSINRTLEGKYENVTRSETRVLIELAEATHSCAAIPFFHVKADPLIGIAYYISGALALNNFMLKYLE